MIIDSHTHIFKPGIIHKKEYYFDDKTFSFLYSNKNSKMIDHELMLNSMNAEGIDCVVAMGFPWEKEKYCDEQNIYFKDIMALSCGRIIPFGSVPLKKESKIDRWVKEIKDMGFAGIGEIAFYTGGMNKNNEVLLRKILESAACHSMPVNLHVNEPVGHYYPGKYNTDLTALYSIIKDYPDIPIILAHWGGGLFFYELMPEINDAFTNIYYDTAASPFLYKDDIYDIAVKIIGSERILFGSDFPLINFKRYIDSISKSVGKKENRENILGRNAAKILGLDK